MSVASSVIERNTYLQQPAQTEAAGVDADRLHNSRMRNNLARLLDPANTTQDVVASIDAEGTNVIRTTPVEVEPEEPRSAHDMLYGPRRATKATVTRGIVAQNTQAERQPVFMVTNARADADIFRADNPINAICALNEPIINRQAYASTPAEAYAAARAIAAATAPVAPAPAVQQIQVPESESEDLRPTATTIQYQTIGADGTVIIDSPARAKQEGEIDRPAEREENVKKLTLSRRDKTIIGIIVGLIMAVFVLIIVNSAVISNLNNDIDRLEGMAETARTEMSSAASEYENLTSRENIYNLAVEMGWID